MAEFSGPIERNSLRFERAGSVVGVRAMTSNTISPGAAGGRGQLEIQIKRYERSYRRRLRKLAKSSARLGDLMFSFPAAAFALVSGHGDHQARGTAIQLVKDGASLKHVAGVLGLANWLRRLPPEAFSAPMDGLPNGERFNRAIANRLPDPACAAMWLRWVCTANAAANEKFALWVAGLDIFSEDNPAQLPIAPLALYAWYSAHADSVAHSLIQKPWQGNMRKSVAIAEACGWLDRVMLEVTVDRPKRGPGRYSQRRSGAYQIVPLTTARELEQEGDRMNHCVASYAGMVANRQCLIFSVRDAKRRVATLDVRWRNRQADPVINQMLGPSNAEVAPEIWLAVRQWLTRHGGSPSLSAGTAGGLPVDPNRVRAIFEPYYKAKGMAWPREAQEARDVLWRLRRDAQALSDLA